MNKVLLRDGALELLNELKSNYHLAIFSNMPKEWAEILNRNFSLNNYFEKSIYSYDYGVKKPDSKLYEILLNKYPDIPPKNMIFIDDKLENLQPAKELSMQTIWFKVSDDNLEFTPDYMVQSISELKELFLS